MADNHQVGVEVSLPQAPRSDLVGILDALVALRGIDEAGALATGFTVADQGGVGRGAGSGRTSTPPDAFLNRQAKTWFN